MNKKTNFEHENELLKNKLAYLEKELFERNIKMNNQKIRIDVLEEIIRKHMKQRAW